MRPALRLIAVSFLSLPISALAANAAAPGVRPETVNHCIAHMQRELPNEPATSLKTGCTCQLTHIHDHVTAQDYSFWEAQLAIMGDDRAPQMQRTQNLMRLFQSRGAGGSMTRVADAAEAAIDACHLSTWDTTP
jgi:hypothetical protein